MKSIKIIIILSIVALAVVLVGSYAGAIALPEGVETVTGIVTGINSEEALIRIDGQPYYFKDASAMNLILNMKKITSYQKVNVFFKVSDGKKQVVNIEIYKEKEIN
jgi:hypothetical protein